MMSLKLPISLNREVKCNGYILTISEKNRDLVVGYFKKYINFRGKLMYFFM